MRAYSPSTHSTRGRRPRSRANHRVLSAPSRSGSISTRPRYGPGPSMRALSRTVVSRRGSTRTALRCRRRSLTTRLTRVRTAVGPVFRTRASTASTPDCGPTLGTARTSATAALAGSSPPRSTMHRRTPSNASASGAWAPSVSRAVRCRSLSTTTCRFGCDDSASNASARVRPGRRSDVREANRAPASLSASNCRSGVSPSTSVSAESLTSTRLPSSPSARPANSVAATCLAWSNRDR